MLFKQDPNHNKKATQIAGQITLLFWALLLLVNAIFETGLEMNYTLNSLTILLSGVIVFFVSDLILGIKYKKEDK